jgi:hypothetical protein
MGEGEWGREFLHTFLRWQASQARLVMPVVDDIINQMVERIRNRLY